ncbi:unnamed protein product [Rotaria magnacalcarata]
MGECGSAIKSPPTVDDELINEIKSLINEAVVSIPSEYATIRKKNADRVNAMTLEKVTSKEAKNRIREEVNKQLEPIISEKTANMNPIASKLTRKAIITVVDEVIDKVVNETADHIMFGKTNKFKKT